MSMFLFTEVESYIYLVCFICLIYIPYLSCEVGESNLKSATELAAGLLVVVGFGGYLFLWEVHCPVKLVKLKFSIQILYFKMEVCL